MQETSTASLPAAAERSVGPSMADRMFVLSEAFEAKLISLGMIVFWLGFWSLQFIDKIIQGPIIGWVGRDRFAQIHAYMDTLQLFSEPALSHVTAATITFVALVELAAAVMAGAALWFWLRNDLVRERGAVFWMVMVSIGIMAFFSLGDLAFGGGAELLEHSTYMGLFVIMFLAYHTFCRRCAEASPES